MERPQFELIALKNSEEFGRWPLPPGCYVIGRSSACELSMDIDGLSRRHAQIEVSEEGTISVDDLGSSNGTFVDDQPVISGEPIAWQLEQAIDLGSSVQLRLAAQDGSLSAHGVSLPEEESGGLPREFRQAERYEIGAQIAKGGMGAVLNARQSTIRRSVAMKVILGNAEEDPRQRLRFIEEAQITGQLEHPNIVPVHDAGIDAEGRVFYTMKLVKGITLKMVIDLLKKGEAGVVKKYSLPALLIVFTKVCDALAFAHSKGVTHRDLKPENIMIGSYGEVLLMDWGLAKLVGEKAVPVAEVVEPRIDDSVVSARFEEGDEFATREGSVMGTPPYMAPEQARGELDRLDNRTDIFSLGIILYELLTLERPFKGKSAKEVLDRIKSGLPPSTVPFLQARKAAEAATKRPHLLDGEVPESLSAVALKALAFLPEHRYQAVKEIQADLAPYQNGFATAAEHATTWKQLRLFVRRNKTVSIASAIILVLVCGFTINLLADRAHILAEQSRAEREASRANAALADLKKTAPVLRQLAENEARTGKLESALEKLDAAMALDPGFLESYWRRAWLCIGLERLPAAAAAIRLAAQKDPAHGEWAEILPVVDQLTALPPEEAWPSGSADKVQTHLTNVGALGELAALRPRLRLELDANVKIVRDRVSTRLGASYVSGIRGGRGVVIADFHALPLESLEPLRGLPIGDLSLPKVLSAKLQSLEPLRGMRLVALDLGVCPITDFSPLAGMPLRRFVMQGGRHEATDLSVLKGMPLEELDLRGRNLTSLLPLRGLRLRFFGFSNSRSPIDLRVLEDAPVEEVDARTSTGLTDLSPLRGKPVVTLKISGTGVTDLSQLRGLPVEELWIQKCQWVKDLAPLLDLPKLTKLRVSNLGKTLESLRKHPSLKFISIDEDPMNPTNDYQPVADFWKEYDAQQGGERK